MFAKHTLAASLAALLFTTLPAMGHAETHTEWLQKQLQISDGSIPPVTASVPSHDKSAGNCRYEGASLKVKPENPAAPTYNGGFRFGGDGRVYLPNGQEISAP